ncbi:glycosyltransferase [Thalassorhabdomicrobium marinisediminis]|uniref:Uncharacterized protein n=1 Tax=Thalassorhabdomicrobium marinisediminis TaxID=2170577 RepID=A0A2T7FSP9_9RHOB|nr:glycosyltransferase [Thalassorhabdomicrobium marinisediminis]PVA05194.1 hypothetical protein DC363_16505 [Thalassorhabdomicrobium marinisediminis]
MTKTIKGYVEHVDTTVVAGWAYDETDEATSLRVEIHQDGLCIKSTHTKIERNDVTRSHPLAVNCGFKIRIEHELYCSIMDGSASIWACPENRPPEKLTIVSTSHRKVGLSARVRNKFGAIVGQGEGWLGRKYIGGKDVSRKIIEEKKLPNFIEEKHELVNHDIKITSAISEEASTIMPYTASTSSSFHIDGKHFGYIDRASQNCLDGWLLSTHSKAAPFVLADGIPAIRSEWPLTRRDVINETGVQKRSGFHFEYNVLAGSTVELMAFDGKSIVELSQQAATAAPEETTQWSMAQLIADSVKPDAVAVTCWEGSHNPIGRAKVLYDVVNGKRPVWLFCYLFDEFGGKLWAPLAGSGIRIVAIPWHERDAYHKMFQTYGIKFPTVWMCKPRYPTLLLGANIAAADARLILDFDDNEEHFSMSEGSSGKVYGRDTLGAVRHSIQNIEARTAASNSLAEDFKAEIVRHARRAAIIPHKRRSKSNSNAIVIGFVGTVRPHKRILEAAQAIRIASMIENIPIEFHVHGDIKPDAYRESLNQNKALTFGTVLAEELDATLQTFDIVLTGFPSQNDEDEPIIRYQITSKIGDALSNGLPVLVPKTRSVEDLDDIPGVFLFTAEDFVEVLHRAKRYGKKTKLPKAFTFEGAYRGFQEAEASAPKDASCLQRFVSHQPKKAGKSIVLIWKQPDAGLYGRRVDQLARAIKIAHPDVNVRVVEMLSDSTKAGLLVQAPRFTSDASQILELSDRKLAGTAASPEGAIYDQIRIGKDADAATAMSEYLWQRGLSTDNTLIITFPEFSLLNQIAPVIRFFPLIADIVDNQISWGNKDSLGRVAAQYAWLMRDSIRIVFNSQVNHDFFVDSGLIAASKQKDVTVIPNWYIPSPAVTHGVARRPQVRGGMVNVIYSGNLNDRIDWDLLSRVAGASDKINLHIVGAAARAGDKISELTSHTNVYYHGPLDERRLCELLAEMHFAIMPHVRDNVSTFMNPLKILMYSAYGLKTISTSVPGLNNVEGLVAVDKPSEFIAEVERWVEEFQSGRMEPYKVDNDIPAYAKSYVDLVSEVMLSKLKN